MDVGWMDNLLICSFYTADDYYVRCAADLESTLRGLELDHVIRELTVGEGEEWPEICRKKIGFLLSVCNEYPKHKIFWIDVDCGLSHFPQYVRRFSADIIGFQRGFGSPKEIGYITKSRFWEPCFFGINCTPLGRAFINLAHQKEKSFAGRATDDFFFEEAWRELCNDLTFQVIPSKAVTRNRLESNDAAFFVFGASGKVPKFQAKVKQHNHLPSGTRFSAKAHLMSAVVWSGRKMLPERIKPWARTLARKVGITTFVTNRELGINGTARALMHHAVNGNLEQVNRLSIQLAPRHKRYVRVANALISYANSGSGMPIHLVWWLHPAPGNFGDWLSPYIVSKLTGNPIRYINPRNLDAKHLVCVGSIANFTNPKSVVAGAGISRVEVEPHREAKYFLVRGPETARAIARAGGTAPDIFGDPAIVLPTLFPQDRRPQGKVGVITHYMHERLSLKLPSYAERFDIKVGNADEIEQLIRRFLECDYVLTSAMHPLIVCQAYGVPCGLINFREFPDAVHGDGVKFRDYYLGVDQPPERPHVVPADLTKVDTQYCIRDVKLDARRQARVQEALCSAIEFYLSYNLKNS